MQENIVLLERLCKDSIGTNLFLNASSQKKRGNVISYILFDAAATRLQEELAGVKPESHERKEILSMLHECYQHLCVETSLPNELRIAHPTLLNSWPYYIQRCSEIAKQLGLYEEIKRN